MPTHVSQDVKELKELGRNLYAAMRSDFEMNPNASALSDRLFRAYHRMVSGS